MVPNRARRLAQLKSQATKLEAALDARRPTVLAGLLEEFGFPDLKSFLAALTAASGARLAGNKQRWKRLTPKIRADVKAGLVAGKSTRVIAQETGISTTSVLAIKKSLGLVKSRGAVPVVAEPVGLD